VAGYLGVDSGLVVENFRKAAADRREKTVAAPAEPIRPDEKILLKLFLGSKEARERLIPELKMLPVTESFQNTVRIFDAMFAMHDGGESFGMAELDARLEERDRLRLASIVLADEANSEEISLELGEACVVRLRRAMLETRLSALRMSVREAERAGRLEDALRLSKEFDALARSQRAGGVQ